MSQIVSKIRIFVYPAKAGEINKLSTSSTEFRKFLGLADYYRRLSKDFQR
jgi:hypothetical protein